MKCIRASRNGSARKILAKQFGARSACFAALVASLWLAGCGGEQAAKMTSFSANESTASKAGLFTLTPEQIAHLQIQTVTQAPLVRTLRLSGAVAYNGFRTTPVISQVGGPVTRVLVVPGQHIRAGEPLLYVTSPDYSTTRSTYAKARNAFNLADTIYKRDKDLLEHKAIAQADVELAESARAQAESDLQSSEQALRVLGIKDPEKLVSGAASAEVPLLAPLGGEVVERLVSPGQLLQPGATQCFTLSDMSTVWVLINVYQNDLSYVHVGDQVTIQTDAYPGDLRGKIQYIAPALDPATRTVQARIEAANPQERLKKDMYVTALVNAGTTRNALVAPDSALLRDTENMPYVFLQTGENQFARRQVTVGEGQGGKTQILSGLQAGDKIVSDGALFLQFQNSMQR